MVSDDLNTSADLMKATDLEDSPELKMPSSFHFSSEGDDQDKTLEKAISRITLSSSDWKDILKIFIVVKTTIFYQNLTLKNTLINNPNCKQFFRILDMCLKSELMSMSQKNGQ